MHAAGSIPATLGDLSVLTVLNVSGNQLSGEWSSIRPRRSRWTCPVEDGEHPVLPGIEVSVALEQDGTLA